MTRKIVHPLLRIEAKSAYEDHGYLTPCRIWKGTLAGGGYGQVGFPGGTKARVHKYVWEHFNGPVPDGLQLDHLCRQRACWEPTHLEPVTSRENTMRGQLPDVQRARFAAMTHCKRGHEFTAENTRMYKGGRVCRECEREHRARNKDRINARRAASRARARARGEQPS